MALALAIVARLVAVGLVDPVQATEKAHFLHDEVLVKLVEEHRGHDLRQEVFGVSLVLANDAHDRPGLLGDSNGVP